MTTIGERLRKARQSKGLTLEDAAHDTRIHRTTIDCLEEDDYSGFASVAYAKGFLRTYADYLQVDTGEMMTALEEGGNARFSDSELMDEMKKTIKKDRSFKLERTPRRLRRRSHKPGGAPLLLNFLILAVIAILGLFYFLGYNAASLDEARDEMAKGIKKANLFSQEGVEEERITPSPTKPREPSESASVETEVVSEAAPETETPSATQQGTMPAQKESVVDIAKPEIRLEFTDGISGLSPAESGLPKPRGEMEMTFSKERIPSIEEDDLPNLQRVREGGPLLRPAGTDPAREALDEQQSNSEESPLRAVPVARSR